MILTLLEAASHVGWEDEDGFDRWNLYRGDLDRLKETGEYTQDPGAETTALQNCDSDVLYWLGEGSPEPGKAVSFLITGTGTSGEGDLGTDSAGNLRVNTHACP